MNGNMKFTKNSNIPIGKNILKIVRMNRRIILKISNPTIARIPAIKQRNFAFSYPFLPNNTPEIANIPQINIYRVFGYRKYMKDKRIILIMPSIR